MSPVSKGIAEALGVPTETVGDEIRKMLDEKLRTTRYRPGNIVVECMYVKAVVIICM